MERIASPRAFDRRAFVQGSIAGALTLAASGSLSGCSGPSGEGSDVQAGSVDDAHTVTIAMNSGSEPAAGFDPLVAWGCGEHVHEPLIQSTLVTTNDKMELVGDLATDFYSSQDGLVWTFVLRDDVKFTDGHALTAEDAAFTVNSVAKGDTSEADLSMVEQAVATQDHVLEIHLSKPYNALLYTLAVLGIVPKHAYGEGYGSAPIGSGRYMLKQWDKGQQVIFTANPDYYGKQPNMKRVVVVFMAEDAAFAAARAGQVDIAFTYPTYSGQSIDGYELAAYKTVDSRGISLPAIPSGSTKLLEGDIAYSAGNDVTCDVAMRRAINCGIDRNKMVDHVLNGYGRVAFSVGDGMPWSSEDMAVEYNLDQALDILDKAGWVPGEDTVRVRNGVRAEFDVWYSSDDSARQALANEFCSQVASLGISAHPRGASWDEIYLHQFESPVLWGWGSNAPVEVYELHYSSGWGNYPCYESEMVDSYLDQALAQTTLEESYPYWKKAMWDGEEGVAPQGASTWCWIANVDHLYWKKRGLDVAKQKPHPHGHGWSLVNNVDSWSWA